MGKEKPAARVGDDHVCPHHHGGRVLPPGAPKIFIGNTDKDKDKHAARVGDFCNCRGFGNKDTIVKGAMPVRLTDHPAARVDDITAHGGSIVGGCGTVLIGLAGKSGNVLAGARRCQAMAGGRHPPADATGNGNPLPDASHQSYNNCGIESARQIIQQVTGSSISQEDLLQQAIDNHFATAGTGPEALYNSGPSTATQQAGLLTLEGASSTAVAGTMGNLEDALGQGQGVIASTDASRLGTWPDTLPAGSWHAVAVTGVEYDADGNPTTVYINDTGMGQCGKPIPYSKFKSALDAYAQYKPTPDGGIGSDSTMAPATGLVTTKQPIW
jgi:uncharacterized Zn-binding protein involved in type VI secretion